MRAAIRRALLPIVNGLFWLWTGAKLMMDWIGRSTIADDAEHAFTMLNTLLAWVLQTPWWVPAFLAALTSAALIWMALYPAATWYQNILGWSWREKDHGEISGTIRFEGTSNLTHRARLVGELIWEAPTKPRSFWVTLVIGDNAGPLTFKGFNQQSGDRVILNSGTVYKFYVQCDPDGWTYCQVFDANRAPRDFSYPRISRDTAHPG